MSKYTDYLDAFEDILRVEYCLSKNTINSYRSDILQFIRYIEENPIDEYSLVMYVNTIKATLKNPTIKRKIIVISSWIRFCKENTKEKWDINVPVFKLKRNIPNVMSSHDLIAIQKTVNDVQSIQQVRLRAIVEVLYCTGLRISELLSIKYRDIIPIIGGESNNFTVVGKGNKERTVFMTSYVCNILCDYIQTYKINKPNQFIWINNGRLLTRQTIYLWLKKLAVKANVDPSKVFPHSFRHRLGSDLVQAGMELVEVQKIFGHADIDTTSIYTQLEDKSVYNMVFEKHMFGKKQNRT